MNVNVKASRAIRKWWWSARSQKTSPSAAPVRSRARCPQRLPSPPQPPPPKSHSLKSMSLPLTHLHCILAFLSFIASQILSFTFMRMREGDHHSILISTIQCLFPTLLAYFTQQPHKRILEKHGKPSDVLPGIQHMKAILPREPLTGMFLSLYSTSEFIPQLDFQYKCISAFHSLHQSTCN